MIHVVCPNCGAKLNAKDELAGQTRKCPGCGKAILIPRPDSSAPSETPRQSAATNTPAPAEPSAPAEQALPAESPPDAPAAADENAVEGVPVQLDEEHPHPAHRLERLNRTHRYLICDRTKVVAMWENNGLGWQIHTAGGFASATRNRDSLPSYGEFMLVELKLSRTDAGLRLAGIVSYRLANRWALTQLANGDDRVLSTIIGLGGLGRDQKIAVRQALKDHFMRPVWADSREVLEYLNNADHHSPGVGE
jgi:hypothetical protein